MTEAQRADGRAFPLPADLATAFGVIVAIAVRYSTISRSTASNERLWVDALGLFGVKRYRDDAQRALWLKRGRVLLPVAFVGVDLIVGHPVKRVF